MAKRSEAAFVSRAFSPRNGDTATGHYRDRQVIFTQGDTADAMFRIRRGTVKLTVAPRRNKKAAIAILSAGDCFGEGCLRSNSLCTYTATSIHKSTVDRVSKRVMRRRLRAEPELAKLFVGHLLRRIGHAEDDLVAQLVHSSEQRLARLLLQLADVGRLSGRAPVPVYVDQGTLAQVVGTTRSRVSHFMNQFRKKGLIDYNGSLRVNRKLLTFLFQA